jgi:hypothetical protein
MLMRFGIASVAFTCKRSCETRELDDSKTDTRSLFLSCISTTYYTEISFTDGNYLEFITFSIELFITNRTVVTSCVCPIL